MKYIKTYKIFENNSELISKLERLAIKNYTINNDGSIDVKDDVNLEYKELTEIPFLFGKVDGTFDCKCNNLGNLVGCPLEIGKDFICSHNNLTSLEYCPSEIGRHFYCSNNKLTSLKGCPTEVGGDFNCSINKLTSLEYCPLEIGENLYCTFNELTMLDCSSYVKGDIYCFNNNFTEEPEFFGDCEGKIKW